MDRDGRLGLPWIGSIQYSTRLLLGGGRNVSKNRQTMTGFTRTGTWVERLFSCAACSKTIPDLSTMLAIDEWQGRLHRRFSSILIAGTNGKGSTALKIANALRYSGLNVGLYTSPHISTYRERIQVNGAMIPDEFAEGFLPTLFAYIDRKNLKPSFFELLTAVCFEYFASKNVDIAVLEVGLGGQLDATNVVIPQLSVITSIGYDHMEILGQTLDEIARAKAGIIKEGISVIVGPRARFAPILEAAKTKAILVSPTTGGFYDDENNAIARKALEFLQIPESAITVGLKSRPSCRFEIVHPRPIILDVAHNPDGFARLRQALTIHFPREKFQILLAMGKTRDPVACLEPLREVISRIFCVSTQYDRLFSAHDLALKLRLLGNFNAEPAPSIHELVAQEVPTVICGTFYVMCEIRRILGICEPTDPNALMPIRLTESKIEKEKPAG